ncbi:MAG: ATP-dependent DNA helicase RecG [Patescibacteria group bacterium]|jgi:ATP-dependent DNA helicase RecG
MKITLTTPISDLPRVGPALTKKLSKLGLHAIMDLLFYYPFRYEDFSRIIDIAQIKINESCTIRGKITIIANKRSFRRRMFLTECLINDKTGSMKVVWFNQPFITKMLKPGDDAFFSGKIEQSTYGIQMVGPAYEKVKQEQTHTARIVPVYSSTENLTAKQIRFLIKSVLPLAKNIPEWVPSEIISKYKHLPLYKAIEAVHFPLDKNMLFKARERLKFDELFLIQLKTQAIRQKVSLLKAPVITFNETLTKKFVNSLPFTLTRSQKSVAWQILKNLQKTRPMNRLLEGDVGSGKTVVASMAMLNTVANGLQSSLMTPTEILASQHYQTISSLFKKMKVPPALLTRTEKKIGGKKTTEKNILRQISLGQVKIIIGTHALIQKKVNFKNLGLVIIDEQHRFGVDQRKLLKQKTLDSDLTPHLLSMTATPIPRSLALTLYGDLDLSVLTEMPKGRKKILTKIVPPEKRQLAYDFIRGEIKKGRQVFVICPLIEESDKLGVKAATQEYEKLRKKVFPELQIGLLHGKLKAEVKDAVMCRFQKNIINILVATSVVEVGIDVPNASVMMIEGAERFGLAQLHQFRGRVGRAEHQSYCFVFTDSSSEKTAARLQALVTAKNGFELAEKDLEFRGPGEIYGLRQSGFPDLKIAKLSDFQLIEQTKKAAESIFTSDPSLKKYPQLREKMASFSKNIHLE